MQIQQQAELKVLVANDFQQLNECRYRDTEREIEKRNRKKLRRQKKRIDRKPEG